MIGKIIVGFIGVNAALIAEGEYQNRVNGKLGLGQRFNVWTARKMGNDQLANYIEDMCTKRCQEEMIKKQKAQPAGDVKKGVVVE